MFILLDAYTHRLNIPEAEARLARQQRKIGRRREEFAKRKTMMFGPQGMSPSALWILVEEGEAEDLYKSISRERSRRKHYAKQKPFGYVQVGASAVLLLLYWFALRGRLRRALRQVQQPMPAAERDRIAHWLRMPSVLSIALFLAHHGGMALYETHNRHMSVQEGEAQLMELQEELNQEHKNLRKGGTGEPNLAVKGRWAPRDLTKEWEASILVSDFSRDKSRLERRIKRKPLAYAEIGIATALLVTLLFLVLKRCLDQRKRNELPCG